MKYAKISETAILLHHKIPHWDKQNLMEFISQMITFENELTSLNFKLNYNYDTSATLARINVINRTREAIFNNPYAKQIGAFTFYDNPEDAAIRFTVGKRYANHADGESLTFKF